MKIGAALLAGAVGSALCAGMAAAYATEVGPGFPCVKVYERTYNRYQSEVERLERLETELNVATAGIGGAATFCMWRTKSIIGCALVFGGGAGAVQLYRSDVSSKIIEVINTTHIYQLYSDLKRGRLMTDNMHRLMTDVHSSVANAQPLADKFVRLMESGTLCTEKKRPISYEELLKKLIDPASNNG